MGSQEIARPVVGLSNAKHGAFSDANYDGNVGSGVLKRFVVTFDYVHRAMYVEPALKPAADFGHFDRVGVWLDARHASEILCNLYT